METYETIQEFDQDVKSMLQNNEDGVAGTPLSSEGQHEIGEEKAVGEHLERSSRRDTVMATRKAALTAEFSSRAEGARAEVSSRLD